MSAQKPSERDIEIEQDPAFQRREWAIQRVGWAVIGALIVAALIGAFGDGPVARAEAVSPDGSLRVHYDRIARNEAMTALHISVRGPRIRSGTVHIWLDRRYVEDMAIQHIMPQPDSVSTDESRLHFVLGVGPGADSAGIHIQLHPASIGSNNGAVGVENGATVSFRQYVLP